MVSKLPYALIAGRGGLGRGVAAIAAAMYQNTAVIAALAGRERRRDGWG